MTIQFENPFTLKMHDKYREEEKEQDPEKKKAIRTEIDALQKQSYEFTQQKLAEFKQKIVVVQEKKAAISQMPTDTKSNVKAILKEITNTYRDAVDVYLSLRELRKQFREQLDKM